MSSKLPISHTLGLIHMSWSIFELTLEVLCKNILKIEHYHSCIVFASLTFKAKQEIAISLVKDSKMKNKDEIVKSIRKITNIASRNHLFHSVIFTDQTQAKADFVKREIQSGLKIKRKSYEDAGMIDHLNNMADECIRLQELTGISAKDIEIYTDFMKAYK